jgi:hypothetical protein
MIRFHASQACDAKVNQFLEHVSAVLKGAGIDAALIEQSCDPENFGNAICVFRAGTLLIKFTRDRSQEFLDIAVNAPVPKFFRFDAIAVAMGWQTIDAILERETPEALNDIVKKFASKRDALADALAANPDKFEMAKALIAARIRATIQRPRAERH